jgi:histidinol-phosphate aminotransferase
MMASVWASNPKYKDGTRLRTEPSSTSAFNGVWVPNDSPLVVVERRDDFVLVRKDDGDCGWIRARNLSSVERVAGVTKDVVSSEVVTPDPEYVRGMRIYGVGIKEDPVKGSKFGKGLQHLISSQWLSAFSEFLAAHFGQLQEYARYAETVSEKHPGFDYNYFLNAAAQLFARAETHGLSGGDAVEWWHCATWLVMAAAEVDDFAYRRYTKQERAVQRAAFYKTYRSPAPGPGTTEEAVVSDNAQVLGKFATRPSRRDLIPRVALERLGLNNELSALKYADPAVPLREGFLLSSRIDSVKRHLDAALEKKTDEDHVIHLLWNFHAIFHVSVVFPLKNDLVDYANVVTQRRPAAYEPVSSLEKIMAQTPAVASAAAKLDWNEGAVPPPASVSLALQKLAADVNTLRWYPPLSGGMPLKQQIASYAGCIPENVLITSGSDDALVLLCRAFLGPHKSCLVPVPTYEHWCTNVEASGATLVRLATADPFAVCEEEIAKALALHHPTVAYLVSPCNPTGVQMSPATVQSFSSRFPDTLFVVDEAYVEFGDSAKQCVALACSAENVVVTRTFSKAFCLASVRVGYMIAHPNTVEQRLRPFYNPKSVNLFAVVAASAALRQFDSYYRPYIEQTNATRAAFLSALTERGIRACSGGAGNFVCVYAGSECKRVCAELEKENIFVRDISARFTGFFRVTIGVTEMQHVERAIVKAMKGL